MVNTNSLKSEITKQGLKQNQVFSQMGLTKRQWQTRLEQKKFDSNEIYALIKILNIENPVEIFFTEDVT